MGLIKDVIIFGAGASHADGAPLQKDLIKEYIDYLKSSGKLSFLNDGNIDTDEKKQLAIITEYFQGFWGIDLLSNTQPLYPSFEDCLGILDIAKDRNENFKLRKKEDLEKYRNVLIFLIAKAIEKKLMNRENLYHTKLVNRLKSANSLKSTAFISLNYDIIIDNVLSQLRGTDQIDLDYGIDFMNFDRPHSNEINSWLKPDPGNAISLFKLHGSLNWLYCSTCNQIEITPKEKGAVKTFTKSEPCKNCNLPMEPIIIPPTYFKDMNNLYIQQIFQKIDKILQNSEKIYLCGYSLPDADMHIKYLLKRAELFNSNISDIFIINNHKGKINRKEEKEKFQKFFKNKEKVHYLSLTFEEFCESGVSKRTHLLGFLANLFSKERQS